MINQRRGAVLVVDPGKGEWCDGRSASADCRPVLRTATVDMEVLARRAEVDEPAGDPLTAPAVSGGVGEAADKAAVGDQPVGDKWLWSSSRVPGSGRSREREAGKSLQ